MRDCVGFEGLYGVTSCGKVWSYKRKKFIAQRFDKDGYPRVTLSREGKIYTIFVHKLMADAYLEKPEGKNQVNHIDEVKTHNWLSNLEWVTPKENINHGTRTERAKKTRQKPVRCVETGVVYECVKAAAAAMNCCFTSIQGALDKPDRTSMGYHWEHVGKEAANDE